MGYTGGTTAAPTYDTVCAGDGHTEAVRVEFDPSVLTYEALIRRYFDDPKVRSSRWQREEPDETWPAVALRHRTKGLIAVWPADESQREACRAAAAADGKEDVPIRAPTTWTEAEPRHFSRKPKSQRNTIW